MSNKESAWSRGPTKEPQPIQKQQFSAGPSLSQIPSIGQHRSLPPYQGMPPQQQQAPVLPPPSSMGVGGSFYHPSHSLSLPGLSSTTHQLYSLPSISGASSHVSSSSGSSSGNAVSTSAPHVPHVQLLQQNHPSQSQQNPVPPSLQRSSVQNHSPLQSAPGIQNNSPVTPQSSKIPPLSVVQMQESPLPSQSQAPSQLQQSQKPQSQLQSHPHPPLQNAPSQHTLASSSNPNSQQNKCSPHISSSGQVSSSTQQAAASQMPPSTGVPGHGPGGPILNDALSYLDQVKFQFQDQPDVYNKFLDIMKDFKSQAIDTPGVIDRVSTLFSGHPSLIQGFNTFLPPGYRIECSQDPRDTKITVTTPSGIHHATSGENVSIAGNLGIPLNQGAINSTMSGHAGSRFFDQQGSQWGRTEAVYGYGSDARSGRGSVGQQSQPEIALEMHRQQQQLQQQPPLQPPTPMQPQPQPQPQPQSQHQMHSQYQVQAHAHQQTQLQSQHHTQHAIAQQGVSQLQSAAAHTNGGATKGQPSGLPVPNTSIGDPRGGKGPVEFNHAISYVNKIKNRFSNQPEIYKTFLEILQTYQRESKPIQDVYSQVTQLFHSAPDLLEDFKQFLPESAAQARAAAAAKAAADEAAGLAVGPAGSHASSMGISNSRLPAVGTFAPPPAVGKEAKKKRGTAALASIQADIKSDSVLGVVRGVNKRHKLNQKLSLNTEQQIASISPTLTPFRPEPLGPPCRTGASMEELAFFDRVKKFIGNKQTYNEFLKLLNLFSQGLIGKDTLVEKVHNFVGGNGELMNWFKRFVGYDAKDEILENNSKFQNKVRLSVCRGLGPSYRLLPRLESQKPCSGRDEMCWEVLNDQWASHPTWASEDSGFVAHKKNQHEDVLHRIEEERHDYDFNIEANLRTIQLLEPIAQRIASMLPEEKATFKLQPGLGGQSKTIYKRVIKKVYDREKGLEVIEFLHNNPVQTVPIVLKRLKQKDEEWKAAQREWQKVWRDQTARVFWKSLDHQGIIVKANDKKFFNIKSLVNDIQAKHKEQLNRRLSASIPAPEYQFRYKLDDFGVILDASRLLAVSLEHNNIFSAIDREKIDGFIKSFVPLFFGMNSGDTEDIINSSAGQSPDEDGNDGYSGPNETHILHARQHGVGLDNDLLRDVLKRGKLGKHSRKDKEHSVAQLSRESRESSPGTGLRDQDVEVDETLDHPKEGFWIAKPLRHLPDMKPGVTALLPENEQHISKRYVYTLYCNNTIYGFFRLFQILCARLSDVKGSEDAIRADVDIRKTHKVANELNIASSRIQDLFPDTSSTANYYSQVLDMCEKFVDGEIDSATFEEGLRSVYVQQGWKLYTIDRLLLQILKAIQSIVPSDTKEKNQEKEKNADIILRFQRDRERRKLTQGKREYQELITYRRCIESMLGPEDNVFRIDWHEDIKEATVRYVPRDEATINEELDRDERWNYYIQTYMMCSPTEGIPSERCQKVFLKRNYPNEGDVSGGSSPQGFLRASGFNGALAEENMEVRICVNTYRLFFMPATEDFIMQGRRHRAGKGAEYSYELSKRRKQRWREHVLPNLGWLKPAKSMDLDQIQQEWERTLRGSLTEVDAVMRSA